MRAEENPLLGDRPHPDTDTPDHHAFPSDDELAVYDRFSQEQKRVILAIVSLAALIPMFTVGCFVPLIPQISRDFDATPAAVSLGVSLPMFASSFGAMFWSAYTSFYGRRSIYLCGMPITILSSFAAATSSNLETLLFWLVIQSIGSSGIYAIGTSTIGDIYKLEERGTAMGAFLGVTLFGLAIAPPVGGISAQLWSWRVLQAMLGAWSVIQTLLIVFFLPETAHPGSRGIDKLPAGPARMFVWVNPFRCLSFLRSPNILTIALASFCMLMSDFTLSIPIAYTVGAKYGISSEGMIGMILLSNGFGSFVGAPFAGRICDVVVRRARKERGGVWVPEDRFRAVWIGAVVLIPISVTLSGLTTTYVDGTLGLAINIVCLFTNGIGVDMVLTPVNAYTVDVMPSRSAEVMAAIMAFRSVLFAPACALCIPAVQTIGVAATDAISSILVLFGYGLIWLTMRYGAQMRAYVDVGYPDFDALPPPAHT